MLLITLIKEFYLDAERKKDYSLACLSVIIKGQINESNGYNMDNRTEMGNIYCYANNE